MDKVHTLGNGTSIKLSAIEVISAIKETNYNYALKYYYYYIKLRNSGFSRDSKQWKVNFFTDKAKNDLERKNIEADFKKEHSELLEAWKNFCKQS